MVQDAGETDRQTDSMTLAEPTPDMTERKCFSNVLTARVLKSRRTETTRSVEQSLIRTRLDLMEKIRTHLIYDGLHGS